MDELLTPSDVARIIGVTEDTLNSWRWRNSGPTYVKIGARVRYPTADLKAWLDARTHLAQPNAREVAS